MLKRYLNKLYMQYCESIGKEYNQIDISNPPSEFIQWLTLNKVVVNKYKEYLDFLGYINEPTAEIGKGVYDSIAGRDMEVISPFGGTLNKTTAEIHISEGNVFCRALGRISPLEQKIILTHNPYSFQDVSLWSNVHNKGDHRISIGIYGKVYDKDKTQKIESLERIADSMISPIMDYDEMGDMYFMSLNDKRKVKERIKTK